MPYSGRGRRVLIPLSRHGVKLEPKKSPYLRDRSRGARTLTWGLDHVVAAPQSTPFHEVRTTLPPWFPRFRQRHHRPLHPTVPSVITA